MALPALLFLAFVGVALASRASSTSTSAPELGPRDRVPEDLELCRVSAAEVSILDSSALMRWISCEGRTATDVAALVARLQSAARDYPGSGYDETASRVRAAWNAQIDAAEAAAARAAPPPPRPRTTAPTRPSYANRGATPAPSTPSPTPSPTPSTAPSAPSRLDALEAELARAERIYPPARREYAQALREASPSELRQAADQIEDQGFPVIAASLRRRAVERERAR